MLTALHVVRGGIVSDLVWGKKKQELPNKTVGQIYLFNTYLKSVTLDQAV